MMALRWARVIAACAVVGLAPAACFSSAPGESEEPRVASTQNLAPTSANITAGADFHDGAGRLWNCYGKAQLLTLSAEAVFATTVTEGPAPGPSAPPPKAPLEMTVPELAASLRPVRLVSGYEYRLSEPDTLLAQRIVAMTAVPTTASREPSPDNAGLRLRHVIGNDDRTHVTATGFGASAYGHIEQGCTLTMIGPSTALSAAHCFYHSGGWIAGGLIAQAANNNGPGDANFTTPNGTYYADSITIPGAWITGAGTTPGTASSHSGWDWDFAVVEFAPSRYPGYSTGWYGTTSTMAGYHYVLGYPSDKLYRSQWLSSGYYATLVGARYTHYIDVTDGYSGGCVNTGSWSTGWYCTGIQSSHWISASGSPWNEARAWDSTTYAFFDTYGNWP